MEIVFGDKLRILGNVTGAGTQARVVAGVAPHVVVAQRVGPGIATDPHGIVGDDIGIDRGRVGGARRAQIEPDAVIVAGYRVVVNPRRAEVRCINRVAAAVPDVVITAAGLPVALA